MSITASNPRPYAGQIVPYNQVPKCTYISPKAQPGERPCFDTVYNTRTGLVGPNGATYRVNDPLLCAQHSDKCCKRVGCRNPASKSGSGFCPPHQAHATRAEKERIAREASLKRQVERERETGSRMAKTENILIRIICPWCDHEYTQRRALTRMSYHYETQVSECLHCHERFTWITETLKERYRDPVDVLFPIPETS